jgi:hypothetical protein
MADGEVKNSSISFRTTITALFHKLANIRSEMLLGVADHSDAVKVSELVQ